MANETTNLKEYPISDKVKEQTGVKRIYDRPDSDTIIVIEFNDDIKLSVYFDDEKRATEQFVKEMKEMGKKKEIVALLPVIANIKTEKMQTINQARQEREQREKEEREAAAAAAVEEAENEEEISIRKETVCKYTPSRMFQVEDGYNVALYEAANIRGVAKFVGYDRSTGQLVVRKDIKDTWENWHLKPYQGGSHHLYEFLSQDEIEKYIKRAKEITLVYIWDKVYDWVRKCYDTDNLYEHTIITALIIYSNFADIFGLTPYLFLHGDSNSGKGAILKIMELLGYRFSSMSLSSAAAVYRLLGDVEPGQVSMFMDELSYLDRDPNLIEVLKLGYEISAKITKSFDTTSATLESQKHFYPFCIKVFASEHLPKPHIVGGFMTRTFFIETFYGIPEIDIKEIAAQPNDPENAKILAEIEDLRKLIWAYRLVHFGDVFPKVKTNLRGRHRELSIGSLTLFTNTDKYELVKRTFYHFIAPQIEAKVDSFTVYMASLIKHLSSAVSNSENKDKLDSQLLDGFEQSFNAEMEEARKTEEARGKDPKTTPPFTPKEATQFFTGTATLDSDLIWHAILRVLPSAEEVNSYWDNDEDNNNSSSSSSSSSNNSTDENKKKKKVSNFFSKKRGGGQKRIRSPLFPDITWQGTLSRALYTIGGKPEKRKHVGKRVWVMDSNKIARFEKSYSQSLIEVTSVINGSEKDRERTAGSAGTSTTSCKDNPNNSDKKEGNFDDGKGENNGTTSSNKGNGSSTDSSNNQESTQKTANISDENSELSLQEAPEPPAVPANHTLTNDSNNSSSPSPSTNESGTTSLSSQSASGQTSVLLPPPPPPPPVVPSIEEPQSFAGDGTHDTLFYGQPWVCWDLEWDPITSKIYAASFVDYKNERHVLHLKDAEFDNDEGKLLDKFLEILKKYPVSFAYYSTGLEHWNGKGKDSDLITLHKRLQENGRLSPLILFEPEKGYGSRRYKFKDYWGNHHTHIDLFSIFSNKVVKNFLEAEEEGKYGYRSDYPKLEDVAKALTGKGKLNNLTGLKVLKLSKEEQKDYVLQDSALLYDIVLSKPGKMVIDLLNEFAKSINVDLEWICHTTITAWWTKIFDNLGCTRPEYQEKEPYDGGLVLPCKSGYYENVVLVDVKSLYPTMAIIHNLGFDTINCSCCKHDPKARVPRWALIDPDGHPIGKEYWVCRQKVSVYRDRLIVFRDLKDAADKAGKKMSKQAYKLLMNASYGSFATHGFGYLFTAVSELITGWGRYTLRVMNAVALAMGLEPIAGDTDSLFLANVKSKEQLDAYFKRCQELLRVQDPLTETGYWDVEIENKLFDKSAAPITYKRFWNIMKKHYSYVRTDGKFDSTSLEIEKSNTVDYSGDVLWKQWKSDLECGLDPIINLKKLISEQELKTVLENNPELLRNSQELGENPGIINPNTGELKGCTYKDPDTPLAIVAREQGLELGDICYYYKTGENKRIIQVDETTDKPLGTYTTNPKYASITKIKEDIASAWMNPLKVYMGYKIPTHPEIFDPATKKTRKKKQKEMTPAELAIMKADKEAEHKIAKEVFGLGN